MRRLLSLLSVSAFIFALTFAVAAQPAKAQSLDPENTLYLDLKDGRVVIQMLPDIAPKHVKRIKQLVREGFYDGLTFHRVIPGFMAQGGDPAGNGSGGTGINLPAEFSRLPFDRGVVAAARLGHDINSGDSQFFITFKASPWLNNQYTIWGRVTEGMQYVDNIKKGDRRSGEILGRPDKIVRMQVAADANN